MKKSWIVFCLAMGLLAGCGAGPAGEESPAPEPAAQTDFTGVLSADELQRLDELPALERADLSGSLCYDEMDAWAAAHPAVELVYTLPLGGVGGLDCPNNVSELELQDGAYDYAALLAALPHLRQLQALRLPDTALGAEELAALAAARPEASLHWSRSLLGQTLTDETVSLDLSGADMAALEPELPLLKQARGLQSLELMTADGASAYSLEDALAIREALPEAAVHYVFPLFGQSVDSLCESLSWRDLWIGDEGLPELRRVLPLLSRCEKITLDDCGTTNEAMAALRDEMAPRCKLVWRVHYGLFSDLTDTRVVHAVAEEHDTFLSDELCRVLRYCTDTEYIDLGHNTLRDMEFLRYMPHLKMAVLSYNQITDLSPLENCRELEVLELFSCRYLKDLSPLAGLSSLKMLNISHTHIDDITPLYGLTEMELLHCARSEVPAEQVEAFAALAPDCLITREGTDIHQMGWRFESPGEYYPWYAELREAMGYARGEWSHKS